MKYIFTRMQAGDREHYPGEKIGGRVYRAVKSTGVMYSFNMWEDDTGLWVECLTFDPNSHRGIMNRLVVYIRSRKGGFTYDLMTATDIANAWNDLEQQENAIAVSFMKAMKEDHQPPETVELTPHKIGRILAKMDGTKRLRATASGQSFNLWAIRNHDRYSRIGGSRLYDMYESERGIPREKRTKPNPTKRKTLSQETLEAFIDWKIGVFANDLITATEACQELRKVDPSATPVRTGMRLLDVATKLRGVTSSGSVTLWAIRNSDYYASLTPSQLAKEKPA